ncbi:MAG: translation initiation factor IF-2 subunit alpha [Candidatus Micrarchaeia archaeon]
MKEMPKEGELVIATIKKILPYGAFCTLDEYNDTEAFLHVSEVAPRWIKNIHEHIREGQKVIAKVYRYIPEKNQIDITLKRVSESDRAWKREQYRKKNRALKMLEMVAKKLRRDKTKFVDEMYSRLEKDYESPYSALEDIAFNTQNARKKLGDVPDKVFAALEDIAKDNIKKQMITLSRKVKIECFAPDGVKRIRDTFTSISSTNELVVKYLGAPMYRIDITADDYKTAEKEFTRVLGKIRDMLKDTKHKISVEGDKE